MSAPTPNTEEGAPLKTTPLHEAHIALGARMVPFAGYDMPVQYTEGVLKEHLWTREHAGIFDVSHMGQARLRGVSPLFAFEEVVPGDFINLKLGRQKYSVLLNRAGGIIDDLMASRPVNSEGTGDDGLFVVVNGACKENDFKVIEGELAGQVAIERLEDRALIALQGPEAAAVFQHYVPEAASLVFMDVRLMTGFGVDLIVSRSGYTGEDGYEISVPGAAADDVWIKLLSDPRVKPIGLGARDSLRLEAGLPLYGHDLDETVSPVEGDLAFAINKNRREQRDFPGAARIAKELAEGPARVRVALRVLEGAPAREGAEIADASGAVIGVVTSGGFSPSLKQAIAMGFVPPAHAALGAKLQVIVRGKPQPAEVVKAPFVPHRYVRKA
ncbi:glycine cleavage system aminomethyltransferase GcvT [Phenylobacterium sp.]|uniref:glycine cleavage system aminomethyltransferase GcvT n=1 Tax=Phenylobacterium sp. TaxID=1871053 RepID=UPI003568602D